MKKNSPCLLLCMLFFANLCPSDLQACLEVPANPPPVWIHGDPCDDNYLLFVIHNYTTFAADPTHYCACALNMPSFLGTVIRAEVVLAGTLEPLPGFSFEFNPATGNAYGQASPGGNWMGFSSGLSAAIELGNEVDVVFTLIPETREIDCSQWLEFVRDFYNQGNLGVATGGADAEGIPNDHIAVLPFGPIEFAPAIFRENCQAPPPGLVSWWPFDEPTGKVALDIEAGHDGIQINGPVSVPGLVGNALRFDGQNDYVEVADHSDLNMGTGDFSIDVWVRTTDNTGLPVLVEKRTQVASLK